LRSWLRSLSDRQELALVLIIGFGPFATFSLSSLLSPSGAAQFSSWKLFEIAVQEILLLSIICGILKTRGWRVEDVIDRFRPKHLLGGIGLALFFYLVWGFVFTIGALVFPADTPASAVKVGALPIPLIVVYSIVNSVFEEVFVVAFIFASVKKWGSPNTALLISVGVRVSCHLYQGLAGCISITLMGLIFALAYRRWRAAWPLVIGHALLDVIGFVIKSNG